MLRRILKFSFPPLYYSLFLYLYTLGVEKYEIIVVLKPELLFLYLLIGLFIYSFFEKLTNLDCLLAHTIITYATVYQYLNLLSLDLSINLGWYHLDNLVIMVKIILFITVNIIFWIMYLLEDKDSEVRLNSIFLFLIWLCMLGIIIFTSANNLIVLYLGIELQSLAIYILCCLKYTSIRSIEAGLKYFIYGSFASLILLLGISIIFSYFGTLDLVSIYTLINSDNFVYGDTTFLYIGLVFLLSGFLFKLAVVPFHWWLVEIFEGSPDMVTFFLAIVPKLPFFYVLFQLNANIFLYFPYFSYIFIICGLLSVIVGTILALYTTKMKKLLAYSSIAHMGYIIIALGIGTNGSIGYAFYYFIVYLFLTTFIFTIYLLLRSSCPSTFSHITDLIKLKNSNKVVAIMFVFSLLSLAGLPPFMGFYGKLLLFQLLIDTGNYYICFILLLSSIVSCVYYIRLIRFIFFDESTEEEIVFKKIKNSYIFLFISLFFLINFIFLFIQEPLLLCIISIIFF